MILKSENILNIYTHKNKTILCRIKVMPSKGKDKSRKLESTCRCFLTPEQWNTFDNQLEKLIECQNNDEEWDDQKFNVKPNVEVKVQQSNLSTKSFFKFLGADSIEDKVEGSGIEKIKQIYVLEIILDFKESIPGTQEYDPELKTSPDGKLFYNPASYATYTPSKKRYRANTIDSIKTPFKEFLGFEEPYDPFETSVGTIMPKYKPASIKDSRSPNEYEQSCGSSLTEYIPAPINETRSSKDSIKSIHSNNTNDVVDETEDELMSPLKCRALRSKLKKKPKKEIEYIPKSQEIAEAPAYIPTPIDDAKICKANIRNKNDEVAKKILRRPKTPSSSEDEVQQTVKDTTTTLKSNETQNTMSQDDNIILSSATELATTTDDTSPPKKKTKEKRKKLTHHDAVKLRRSGRSPSKPKRLIEQPAVDYKKTKTSKSSPINKELFGSDDDDDNDFEKNDNGDSNNNATAKIKTVILQTPKGENPNESSSSSSTKKKRKRDKSNECEQEKHCMSKWLGKKKSNSNLGAATTSKEKSKSCKSPPQKSSKKLKSNKDTRKRRSKSESPPATSFVMPSEEELKEIRIKTKIQQEQNEKLKAELDKIVAPPPQKVENLSLIDMPIGELLDTFEKHRPVLDDIYEKYRKKDHIKSHDGINHCFVIRLMNPKTQFKMLDKLTDVYTNANSSTEVTLYANAMLPEWIIRIYMEKYKFTREQAMKQIKAQDDYQVHIDEQNDSSFMFDL